MKYFIKARFKCEDETKNMVFKQVLIVREKQVQLQEENTIRDVVHASILNCCKQGYSIISSKFNKNVFTPAEKAEGEIRIDNSNCKLPIRSVIFYVE